MNYKIKHLKNYASDAEGAVPKKKDFRQVFSVSSIKCLNIEIAIENKAAEANNWFLPIKIFCYRNGENGKEVVYSAGADLEMPTHENVVFFRTGKAQTVEESVWVEGEYLWTLFVDGEHSNEIASYINENSGPETTLPFEVVSFRLFEGPEKDVFSPHRNYTQEFLVSKTRCVRAECELKNLSPGASWMEEFIFNFYDERGNIVGRVPVLKHAIQEEFLKISAGWGRDRIGSWMPGKYRAELSVRDSVVGEIEFSCISGDEINEKKEEPDVIQPYIPSSPSSILERDIKPRPEEIADKDAVLITYQQELDKIADYVKNGLSVLVTCDKILVEFIYEYVCLKADRDIVIDKSYDPKDLYDQIEKLKSGQVMVLRAIDILQHTVYGAFMLYHTLKGQNAQFLAFKDTSVSVSNVLTNRFAIHVQIVGMPRMIFYRQPKQDKLLELDTFEYLITKQERHCFEDFNPDALYKQVASLNIFQFRQAMKYISTLFPEPADPQEVYQEIRKFKVNMLGDDIEIPKTTFDDIGGYSQVKAALRRMIDIFYASRRKLDEKIQLKAKGFIFHGPPGTGKTLFAKAIANEMNATIQMISGPEIVEKWVGQSEANMRRVFATARRNAPSVILFDEFDSIAQKRTTQEDGGARVGNSLMAQLLTELDGFREEEGILVIGTTNRLDIIDRALLRPSRLTAIEIGLPDFEARKQVALIHAGLLKIDDVILNTFKLAKKYLAAWKKKPGEVPKKFLTELYEQNDLIKQRLDIEKKMHNFQNELEDLFKFISNLNQNLDYSDGDIAAVQEVEVKIREVGKKYGLQFGHEPEQAESSKKANISVVETDIKSIFQSLQSVKENKGEVSVKVYLDSLFNMIAEFTDGFNNDEIREIFQQAYIDYISMGQVISPRYIGQRIGLVQKGREERLA